MSLSRRGRVLSFFFSSRRRHTRFDCDWSSDVCSSDLVAQRYPSGHALHIVRWMQVITFDEPDVERASELRSDQALAGTADAHHHVEPSVRSAHEVAPIVYRRGIRGYRLSPWTARPARV